MDWVTDAVAIGTAVEAHSPGFREQHGFQGLVSLDGSMTIQKAYSLGYDDVICSPMKDGPGNDLETFRHTVDALIAMVQDSRPVFVHCHAGKSRSVTVIAAFLVVTRGWTIRQAYGFIANTRAIQVQPGLPELISGL